MLYIHIYTYYICVCCLKRFQSILIPNWQGMNPTEITCCMELLLDAAHEFAANGATGGCRAILGVLQGFSLEQTMAGQALRNELLA